MQEPSSIILPDGGVLTKDSDTQLLEQVREKILKNKWCSQEDPEAGTDQANVVLYRWLCERDGFDLDQSWEQKGIGPPLVVRESRANQIGIEDDHGLFCLLDPSKYKFSTDESSWDDLMENVASQIRLRRMLACDVGHGGSWNIAVKQESVKHKAFQQATGMITASKTSLMICGMEQLLHASKSKNRISGLEFDIDPGLYRCSFIQLRPPDYLRSQYKKWERNRNLGDPDLLIELIASDGSKVIDASDVFWLGKSRSIAREED